MARPTGASTTRRPHTDARSRAWRAMRVLREFTLPQLCMAAEISLSNARHYLLSLMAGGFIAKARENQSGRAGSHAVWRLVREKGPDAPIIRMNGMVYDPNTGKEHGHGRG